MATTTSQFKVGICQIKQSKEKSENIQLAKEAIEEAVKNGAQLVVLGEYFNTMYNKIWTMKDAESLDDPNAPTVNFLKEISKRLGVYIVAGSIPERGPEEKIYNTSLVLNRQGWEVIPEKDRMEAVPMQKSQDNGLEKHMLNFVEAIQHQDQALLHAPIEAGAHIAIFSQMGNVAYRTGKKLYWDKTKREFTDGQANRFLAATYHNGYQLPVV